MLHRNLIEQQTIIMYRTIHRAFASTPTIHRAFTSIATPISALSVAGGGDRVVVLGGGWAGFQIALNADKNLPLTVISPSNHFVFTPLLASTAVGTLEFRCIQEPIRTVLGHNGKFIQAKARSLDPENKKLVCESVHNDIFELEYDKLVIAVGVKTNVRSKGHGPFLCFAIFIWSDIR
jgi:NADH dehydrogenase FAD-containing subunit